MPYQLIHQQNYRYESYGSGRPFVLLHGFTGSIANWYPLLPTLAPSHQVILIDILGHGRSASPADSQRYAIEQAAADVVALVQQLTSQPIHLLGYSMGGRLALTIACHYPTLLQSLILESATPGLATAEARAQRRQQDEALADRIQREGMDWFVDFWQSLPLWASQQKLSTEVRLRLRQQRRQNDPVGLANSLRGMGTGAQPSLWPLLPALSKPVLLLAGEEDDKFVMVNRQTAVALPQAQLQIIPHAGHTIHLEQPESYVALVNEWLLAIGGQ